MRRIPLTYGLSALVDNEDFKILKKFSWHAVKRNQRWYAARKDGWKGPSYYMHREIMKAPKGIDVAHWDGDGLNNRRENLKLKTRRDNLRGFCRKKAGATSKFRGVCWDSTEEKWLAQIKTSEKNKYLGRFDSELDAAHAYNKAAIEHFGEDAQLNCP